MYNISASLHQLNNKYDNAIAVLGGAYYAYEAVKHGDMMAFAEFLPAVAQNAKRFNWHGGISGALRKFCHICLIDPSLVEIYLGVNFDNLT